MANRKFVQTPAAEEEEDTSPAKTHHLYRVTFRRRPTDESLTVKSRIFITFGSDEPDAVQRICTVYQGSSFNKEFAIETPTVEFLIAGVLKVGGN